MSQNLYCKFFGLHNYEVIKEERLLDARGNEIGLVIISRCSNCGKIKINRVYTEYGYSETRY